MPDMILFTLKNTAFYLHPRTHYIDFMLQSLATVLVVFYTLRVEELHAFEGH